mmetsp:Transcript_96613/g.207284  ORF Transcript_96613/g.207284 Transcript_96613/m.207284 type:complete len:298 (+) Transcript_96613:1954-2847(+)
MNDTPRPGTAPWLWHCTSCVAPLLPHVVMPMTFSRVPTSLSTRVVCALIAEASALHFDWCSMRASLSFGSFSCKVDIAVCAARIRARAAAPCALYSPMSRLAASTIADCLSEASAHFTFSISNFCSDFSAMVFRSCLAVSAFIADVTAAVFDAFPAVDAVSPLRLARNWKKAPGRSMTSVEAVAVVDVDPKERHRPLRNFFSSNASSFRGAGGSWCKAKAVVMFAMRACMCLREPICMKASCAAEVLPAGSNSASLFWKKTTGRLVTAAARYTALNQASALAAMNCGQRHPCAYIAA